jgi:exonuclease SbcC
MFIERIELENIKSYRRITLDLRRGTTAISGPNGAGKTTIVEAIGYALFDSLPYKAGQFVREGEKHGRIVIHLIGSDDRPYVVERRVGSGASWFLNDTEADARLEQRADVLDKLHDIFGIDRERDLDALFQDALGVPQGTFTSIFLQTPAIRKQTFDTLLQIEDYKTAADYLLDAQKHYKEQAQAQQDEIQRLSFETRDLETWRGELQEERARDRQQVEQHIQWTERQRHAEARQKELAQQRDTLAELKNRYEKASDNAKSAQDMLKYRQQELSLAREAQQIVEQCRQDYQRYQQAQVRREQLRQEERKRNDLRQQQATQRGKRGTIQTNITHLRTRLEEVALAHQRIIDLLPLVEQQYALESQREELTQQATRYDEIVKEGKRQVQQQSDNLKQQTILQQRIAEIEPLQPLAALSQERIEAVASLRAQVNERGGKQRQLQEKRELLRQKQEERETSAARLRQAEAAIEQIEAHRKEAEELQELQKYNDEVSAQRHYLEGNISGYRKSRKQSAGGLCPLLSEPCLNIKRRGMDSLESYFDGLIAGDQAKLDDIVAQQTAIAERITFVKRFADELNKLGQLSELRAHSADHIQRLALEITRLERDCDGLAQELAALKEVEQRIPAAEKARNESQKAEEQVRGLDGLRMQALHLQEMAQQLEATILERRQQASELSNSKKQLEQTKQALVDLNDPRGQTKAQHDIIKQEPHYQKQLQEEEQKLLATEQFLRSLEEQLAAYADLDQRLGEQDAILGQTQHGYNEYLANEKTAKQLPQRTQAYAETENQAEQAQQSLCDAEQAYQAANAAFNTDELAAVEAEVKQLQRDLQDLTTAIRTTQEHIRKLEEDIRQAEALKLELEAAQQEKATLEELQNMIEQFRKLIKEAGPHVLKAMLNDISAEANRIFGEIMGDRAAQLSWQSEYEIVLRRQAVNRAFAQLSGGEQMSAALAVRLALLKKLSSLNIAFFDEPTQNMDELRRTNLAEQIRRVRGFDQLIVISHDDTFEQGLDSIIRLRKENGETHVLTDDEVMEREHSLVSATI